MKKSVFSAIFAAVVLTFVTSCGYQSQTKAIDGTEDYTVYTARPDKTVLEGVQTKDGQKITEAKYISVTYEHGYFIGVYPEYKEYDLFGSDGKEVLSGVKTNASWASNLTDSLSHFHLVSAEGKCFWFFPSNKRIIGPFERAYLYPLEGVIVTTTKDEKLYGVIRYDGSEILPVESKQLIFATRKDVKRVKKNGKFVREEVLTDLIYANSTDGDNWVKYSRETGKKLGANDRQDVDLINASDDTMLDKVYAVREKK